VIIHDAARPLVDEETVLAVCNAAYEHGVSMIFIFVVSFSHGCS